MASKKSEVIEYRRDDGFRVRLTAEQLAETHGHERYERYDVYLKRQGRPLSTPEE